MAAARPEQLDLAYLPMEEPAFAADPLPYFAAARQRHPWLAKAALGYVVHQYQALYEIMKLEDRMVPAHSGIVEVMGAGASPWGQFLLRSIQAQIGAPHQRLRDVLASAFTPRQANLHRPLMRQVISDLLDEWAPRGQFDFEEFASYFPVTVMCRLIGAPPGELPRLRPSLEAMGLGFSIDPSLLGSLEQALQVLDDFIRQLVTKRREEDRSGEEADLLDLLLRVNARGDLTELELIELLVFLFVAGYDTSKNVLTLMMYVLLDKPDIYARCAEDLAFCRKVVEEMLRYFSVASGAQILADDLLYRDVLLPKGSMIFLPWAVAGRDPTSFDDADRFEPGRRQKHRIVFGSGPHICLGQFIARAQLEEGLHLVAQRIRKPERTGPIGWRRFIGIWGLEGLPIRFEPGPPAHAATD